MSRPDFYKGIHPQFDCDIAAKRRKEYMDLLEKALALANATVKAQLIELTSIKRRITLAEARKIIEGDQS